MKSKLLLLGSLSLCISMIAIAWVLGKLMSSLVAILLLSSLYWMSCWLLTHHCNSNKIASSTRQKRSQVNRNPIYGLMTWLPCVGVLTVLLSSSPSLPSIASLAAIWVVAITNGITEEFFWRATFVNAFPKNIGWGLLYPTVLFSLWHIAFLCIPNVNYHGGAFGLLGGSAMLGSLWGYAFWCNRDLRSVTLAHITTNFLAFTMLAQDNWL